VTILTCVGAICAQCMGIGCARDVPVLGPPFLDKLRNLWNGMR